MELSLPTKEQWIKFAKASLYVTASAFVDFVISESTGTQFGTLTAPINILAVFLKQLLTKSKSAA